MKSSLSRAFTGRASLLVLAALSTLLLPGCGSGGGNSTGTPVDDGLQILPIVSDGAGGWESASLPSPDSRNQLFIRAAGNRASDPAPDLYVKPVEGVGTRIYQSPYRVVTPKWSPDGRSIAFIDAQAAAGPFSIKTIDITTHEVREIYTSSPRNELIGIQYWAWDTGDIYFREAVNGTKATFRIQPDGTGKTRVD